MTFIIITSGIFRMYLRGAIVSSTGSLELSVSFVWFHNSLGEQT